MTPLAMPTDSAAYFASDDEIADYLNAWIEDGSPHEIARALGDIARARGVTELVTVLDALGLELSVRKKPA